VLDHDGQPFVKLPALAADSLCILRQELLPPAKMYLDEEASYASNEVAINWNAPLVFLLAGALPEK